MLLFIINSKDLCFYTLDLTQFNTFRQFNFSTTIRCKVVYFTTLLQKLN